MRGDERSALPRFEEWEVVDLGGREGVFTVGRALGQAGRLRWHPLDGEPPHCLVTGSTGGGKTSLMASWALLPALWNLHYGADWDRTLILDPKGGSGFDAAVAHGARVVTRAAEIRDALKSAYNHAERRNRVMGEEIAIAVPDRRGILRAEKPKSFRDLTPEQRAEFNMRPRLLIIDEASDMLGKRETDAEVKGVWGEARAHLRQLVQKARAAGIIVVVGLQRPDAAILDGFTRDQLQARVAVGDMGPEGFRMVLGPTLGKRADEEGQSMTPGQAWTTHIGGRRVAQAYVAKVDLTGYLPFAGELAVAPESGPPSPEGTGSVRGAGWAWLVGPWVRGWLRVRSVRLLGGPVVVGELERSAGLRLAKLVETGLRCEACGRVGQVEVDHDRPLWAGGRDVAGNLRTLCQRPGRPSCHGAKTSAEAKVRALRYRSGGASTRSWLAGTARAVPPYRWSLAALVILGLVYAPTAWQVAAVVALVVLGPVWAWGRARARDGDYVPRADGGADPGVRRQAWFDVMEARKNPRRFRWARVIILHRRNVKVTVYRAFTLRALACFLAGAWLVWTVTHIPAAVAAVVSAVV